MQLFAALSLVALTAAAPADLTPRDDRTAILRPRQNGWSSSQLEQGSCKSVTFVWARGSLEPGNMGWLIGNNLAPILKKSLNNDIAIQGVPYDAGILTNIGPGMADAKGITEATRLIKLALSKCPNAILVTGGYSQGAAVMHRTIEKLPDDIKGKITAVLMYGDTQFPWDGQSIKGFPKEKVKTVCGANDGVCTGGITVTPGHLAYSNKDFNEGANWLVEKIKAAKSNRGSAPPTTDEPQEPSPPKASPPKASPPKASPPKASPPKASPPKASPPKASPPKASPPKASPPSDSPAKESAPKVSPAKASPPKAATPKAATPPPKASPPADAAPADAVSEVPE